ncbi:hypothetical protein EDB83DRAFT_2322880 [Lactarius deliciosus]|nr:hypothetical protein EDB83DRAFT_2322880 [Lactarius deliciosus]
MMADWPIEQSSVGIVLSNPVSGAYLQNVCCGGRSLMTVMDNAPLATLKQAHERSATVHNSTDEEPDWHIVPLSDLLAAIDNEGVMTEEGICQTVVWSTCGEPHIQTAPDADSHRSHHPKIVGAPVGHVHAFHNSGMRDLVHHHNTFTGVVIESVSSQLRPALLGPAKRIILLHQACSRHCHLPSSSTRARHSDIDKRQQECTGCWDASALHCGPSCHASPVVDIPLRVKRCRQCEYPFWVDQGRKRSRADDLKESDYGVNSNSKCQWRISVDRNLPSGLSSFVTPLVMASRLPHMHGSRIVAPPAAILLRCADRSAGAKYCLKIDRSVTLHSLRSMRYHSTHLRIVQGCRANLMLNYILKVFRHPSFFKKYAAYPPYTKSLILTANSMLNYILEPFRRPSSFEKYAAYSPYTKSSLIPTANLMLNYVLKPVRRPSSFKKYAYSPYTKGSLILKPI